MIEDAYDQFMLAHENGKIDIVRYEDWTLRQIEGIHKMAKSEYENSDIQKDYQYFLESKFPWLNG